MAPTPSCLSPPRCRRSPPSVASSLSRRTSTSHNAASMLRMPSCSRLTCQGTRVSGRSSAPPAHKVFAFVSAPIDTPPFLGSFLGNLLCGTDPWGWTGTYTAEGITRLCEALKGSAVTSLKCAAATRSCLSVNAIDTPTLSPLQAYPRFAVSRGTTSETRARPHSQPSSRRL